MYNFYLKQQMLENILTKTTLTQQVEELVKVEKMTYIEAVLHICSDNGIDPADISKLIVPSIKSKIEAEGMAANLLPKSNSLNNFL